MAGPDDEGFTPPLHASFQRRLETRFITCHRNIKRAQTRLAHRPASWVPAYAGMTMGCWICIQSYRAHIMMVSNQSTQSGLLASISLSFHARFQALIFFRGQSRNRNPEEPSRSGGGSICRIASASGMRQECHSRPQHLARHARPHQDHLLFRHPLRLGLDRPAAPRSAGHEVRRQNRDRIAFLFGLLRCLGQDRGRQGV